MLITPRRNYVFIDHENVQPDDLSLLDLPTVQVWIFIGASQAKFSTDLAIAAHAMGERVRYVRITGNGSNALDFHIACYLGRLLHEDPDGYFHIISKDTGFDPLVTHLRQHKATVYRVPAIAQMAMFPQAAKAKAMAVVRPARAEAVVVTVEPVAAPAAVPTPKPVVAAQSGKPAINATQRLEQIKLLLAKHPKNRPAKRASLRNHVLATFAKTISSQQADELIASLVKAGVIRLDGSKVIYR
ncbi:hypothetical protein ABB30_06440 [Stenotrophomonas ginsengisoli]|uniref:PIN-like domain-containing protein n=2 Tax=Stenotrophomonas ginsengisoli TaxID=336566 RepID=A0A0R0D6R4_9GAMM|nr:hypothetical protein ABB30_06440 [Stenotrophomonas ginsengisoli]